MPVTQRYKLNIVPEGTPVVVHASQYDAQSRDFYFTIYNGSELFEIPSGSAVTVRGTKPDKTGFEYSATYNGSLVHVIVEAQMTVLPGNVRSEIRITNGAQILGTANFILRVESAGISDDTQISETELPLIERAAAAGALASQVGNNTSAINTLSARMDEFTRLPDGSTTGDAELADIRVWYDGRTSSTAGDAVRGQIKELHDNINRIPFELIADEYITHEGIIQSYNGWSRTDYIDCSTQKNFIVINTLRETDYCHFYDVEKNPIGSYFNVPVGTTEIETNGAYYFIISNRTGSINQNKMLLFFHNTDYSLTKAGQNADAEATGNGLRKALELANQVPNKVDISTLNCDIYDWSFFGSDSYPLGWRNGRYDTSTGQGNAQNYYLRTFETVDMVKTVDGAKYFNISVPNGYAVCVTEYDANDNRYIKYYGDADSRNSTATQELLIKVEEGKVYKFTVGRFSGNDADQHINDTELINSFILKIYWSIDYANIHDYYFPYIQQRVDRINEVSRTVSPKSFSFAFITDYHSLRNAKQSKKLINYIVKNTGVETVIFGGDAFQNWWKLSASMREVSKVYNILANAGERRFLAVYGNHEWNDIVDQMNNLSGVKQITTNGIYFAQSMDEYGNYYIDNEVAKTRCYFVSSTVEAAITNTSLAWLGRQLETIPNGYNAMVICHCGLLRNEQQETYQKYSYQCINKLLGAYDRHESITLTSAGGAVIGTFDYTNATGFTICYLCGHVHEDLQILKDDDTNGVLTFSTTGDLYKNASGVHYTFVDEYDNTITRDVGTIYEQAFDVIHVDVTNRKIYCTRIGAGIDREFSF